MDQLSTQGGAERLTLELITRLDPERYDRWLCITRSTEHDQEQASLDAVDALHAAGVTQLRLNRASKLDLRHWKPLLRLLRDQRIDVLHGHMFGSNSWGTILGRLAGVPAIVAHEHSWAFSGQPLRKFLLRHLIGRFADSLVVVSRVDEQRMAEVVGVRPDMLHFIPNGIAMPPPPQGDVRAELGIDPGALIVGTVGIMRPEKAMPDLVRATEILKVQYPDVRVVIAGDGPEREGIEALIAELDLGETVILLGPRSDIPDVLAALDVAVCCSLREGSPLSVMEYMEAGLPVVATNVGGVPDLIEDGVHGLLVPSEDPPALARAIGDLLADPARRAEMGGRGRERRRAEFDLDVMVNRVMRLYQSLLPGCRRRR